MPEFQELSQLIKKREESLQKILESPIEKRYPFVENTTFIVARRWNSWYPSFFNIEGGCYFIVPAKRKDQREEDSLEIIVIDPGLKFLSVLRTMGLNLTDISKVIITHLHPDHMGGFLELASLIHTIEATNKIEILANETSKNCLERYYDYPIKLLSERDLTPRYERSDGFFERISLFPFKTVHSEASGGSASAGLRIEVSTSRHGRDENKIITILGDTSFRPSENKHFIDELLLADVSVLHIGSFQEKKEAGKHLYMEGLDDLITAYYARWKEQKRKFVLRPLIILSEFGLEHATEKQLRNALCINVNESAIDFGLWESKGENPIIRITNYFKQKNLEWVTILPGDIGLEISLEQEIKTVLRDKDTVKKVDPIFIEPVYIDGEIKYQDSSSKMEEMLVSQAYEGDHTDPNLRQKLDITRLDSLEDRLYNRILLLRSRDPRKALQMCDVAIELFPKDSRFYWMKSNIHIQRQEYPAALNSINKAIEIVDKNPYYWIDKIRIYMEFGGEKDDLDNFRREFKKRFPDFTKNALLSARTVDYTIKMFNLNSVFVVEPDNGEAKRIMREQFDF